MISSFLPYFAGHALCAFSGGFAIYAFFPGGESPLILFAILALGLVPLFGYAADRFGSSGRVPAAAGLALCAAALAVGEWSAESAVVLAGVGYAAFLAGGGVDSLNQRRGATRTAIFLSPAPVGFALGAKIAQDTALPVQYPIALLVFASLTVFFICRGKREKPDALPVRSKKALLPLIFVSGMLFLASFLRAFVVFSAPVAESDGRFAWLIPAAAGFAGCFLGGIISDFCGARLTSAASALAAAPFFFLGSGKFIMFAAGIFFLSVSVAATVREASLLLPRLEGLAFGIHSAALLAGYLLSQTVNIPGDTIPGKIACPLICAATAALLFFSIRKKSLITEESKDGTEQA